jgi:hypothetical protein
MEITVDTRELVALERRLALAGKATQPNIRRMLVEIGKLVKGKAVAFAPRSMTKSEYVSFLKGGKTRQTADKFHPGQLKKSITTEVFDDRVEIGVPSNSPAGEYAEKVHSTWKRPERQPHNDAQATKEFIFEAQKATEGDYMKSVEKIVDNIIKGI